MHRTPRPLLLVLALLALALASCGGDDLSSKSAPEVLKEAFGGGGKATTSGKLDLRISFDAQGLQGVNGPLKLALKGPFSSTGKGKLPSVAFDANLDVSGQALALGAVTTRDGAWLKLANQAFKVDDATFQQFQGLYAKDQASAKGSGTPSLSALGVDPTRWLAEPKKAGEETVGGAETVHVTSKVDVPKLLEDVNKLLGRADATGAAAAAGAAGQVPSKLTDAQRRQIERSVKATSLDVYAGKDDGTLRRLNIQVTFDVPADTRQDVGGLTTGRLGFDLVLSDLNEDQEIAAPKDARPLSELTGATGAAGAPGTGATGAAPAPSGPDAAYQQCLEAAGADIGKVQACAPLLNGGGSG